MELVEQLQAAAKKVGMLRCDQVRTELRRLLLESLPPHPASPPESFPLVVLVAGVNGSGKTSCVAKLAHWWKTQGRTPLLAAADTFRAAATEQLAIWAKRLGVELISGVANSDPGAVAHRACQAALGGAGEVVIVDTSGRMHTSHNLMQELAKIERVVGKVIEGAPQQAYLVLDATTGQNGLAQARVFADSIHLSGVILAKLDSSARGGVGFAVHHALGLPILFVGTGESLADWAPFDPGSFVDGLLADQDEIAVPRDDAREGSS